MGQSILRQIEAVKDLHNFLCHQVCEEMCRVNANITRLVQNMSNAGVPEETCTMFLNTYYAADRKNMEILINNCLTNDFSHIHKYLNYLNNILISATGRYASVSLDKPNTSQPSTIRIQSRESTAQVLTLQADALCDVLNFLVKTRNNVRIIINKYNQYRSSMADNGVSIQICKHYHTNCYEPNKKLLYAIMNHFQNEDYNYIKEIFVMTVRTLNSINSGYNRAPASM